MKKITLVALVAAVFPLSVLAEPNVTIYGGVDLGVLGQKTHGDSATVSMANGYSYASRFGFRGTEDLGNGYSVGRPGADQRPRSCRRVQLAGHQGNSRARRTSSFGGQGGRFLPLRP